jgi:hypothetical protein
MILTNQPAESTHWYKNDGTPCYTVIGKNGKERNFTLADARKEGGVPSVTTILKVAANEGLNKWIKGNLLVSAATLPRIEGESADDWIARVEEDARKQSQDAASLGTSIHASLEKAFMWKPYDPEHNAYVDAVVNAVKKMFPNERWAAEKSFAHIDGFGGKIDLSSDNVIIDFKTTSFDEKTKTVGEYDEHKMQLAAYAHGLGIKNPRYSNVYVSTSVPGLVKVTEYDPEDMKRYLNMFLHLLHFWQEKNKYGVKNEP